ncbi:MAG: DUF748 domain-containing protein [Variovorax sp.]
MTPRSVYANRWLRWLAWLVLALLLIWLVLWLAVPPVLKSQVQRIASEQLGRTVTIGSVDFKPWSLELTINDFAVANADGSGQQLTVPRIYVDGEIASLFRLAAVVDALSVERPALSLTRREDGILDIDDILARLKENAKARPPDAGTQSSEPFPFSLANVELRNGAVTFVDRVVAQTHELRDLDLQVPRVSSLEAQSQVMVKPKLSFKLDGVPVASSADTTPFAKDRKTDAIIKFEGLSLAPYLGYLPAGVPVVLKSGILDADLKLDLRQDPALALQIGGSVAARQVDVENAGGTPLVGLNAIRVDLADLRPFEQRVAISNIVLEAPRLALARTQDGRLSFQSASPAAPAARDADAAAAKAPASGTVSDPTAGQREAPTQSAGKPWQIRIDKVAVNQGQAVFSDQSVRPPVQAHLRELQVSASAIAFPFAEPLKFDGSTIIGGPLPAGRASVTEPLTEPLPDGARLTFSGNATDQKGEVNVQLAEFDLAPYRGYLPPSVPVAVKSLSLATDLQIGFERKPELVVKLSGSASARHVDVENAQGQPLMAFDSLQVALADVRPLQQQVKLSSIVIEAPRVALRRNASGQIDLGLTPTGAPAKDGAPAVKARASAAPPPSGKVSGQARTSPWHIEIDKFALAKGRAVLSDESTEPTAQVAFRDLQLTASAIRLPFGEPLSFSGSTRVSGGSAGDRATAAAPADRAKMDAAKQAAGQAAMLKFSGTANDQRASIALQLADLDLGLAAPYVSPLLVPGLVGSGSVDAKVEWRAASNGGEAAVTVTANRLALGQLALVEEGRDLARIEQFEMTDARVSLAERSVSLGTVKVTQPKLPVERAADGRWMFQRWLRGALTTTVPQASPGAQPSPGSETVQLASQSVASQPNTSLPVASQPSTPQPDTSPLNTSLPVASQPGAPPSNATAVGAVTPAAPGSGWSLKLGSLAVQGGEVAYSDLASPAPVKVDLSELQLELRDATLAGSESAPIHVAARVAAAHGEPGRVEYTGQLAWSPRLRTRGTVNVERLPVHAFEPYFGASLNVELNRADTSFKGMVDFVAQDGGPKLDVEGDATVENMRANNVAAAAGASAGVVAAPAASAAPDQPAPQAGAVAQAAGEKAASVGNKTAAAVAEGATFGEELLNWKTLNLRGLKVALAPGQAPAIGVSETALSDFFARIILFPDGRLNLQGLVKSDAAPAPSAASEPDRSIAAAGRAATANTAGTAAKAVIDIGPVSLVNGRIYFSDLLIKPNYSANLSDLTGKLGAFSSRLPPNGTPEMAALELRGRTEQSASIEIKGKLNPLAKPLELDIKGQVKDLELPPFSPYSVKYAGHAIDRGKLSMDVHYVVQPDGRITATNQLVLRQLVFGDKVEGAPNSLPVKLAVALLADRNGVIDLDLPISGSLDNPQFSIWDVLGTSIGNLLSKAITAPFSLLAKALGGGASADALDSVAFAPGRATLTAKAKEGLDKVAKALEERPELKLSITGSASMTEREAIKQRRLAQLLEDEKHREPVADRQEKPAANAPPETDGASSSAAAVITPAPTPPSSPSSVAGSEAADGRTALLRQALKRFDVPQPQGDDGKPKALTPAEMESLLLAQIEVDQASIRELAVQRGVAVRDYLAANKGLQPRLFLGAVDLAAPATAAARSAGAATATFSQGDKPTGQDRGSSSDNKWTPHVQLDLETR